MLGASATFAEGDDVIGSPQRAEERNIPYRDVVGAALALILVVVAFVVPRLGNETITPIVNRTAESVRDFADAAPLFGFATCTSGGGRRSPSPSRRRS